MEKLGNQIHQPSPGAINTGIWERLGISVPENEVMDINEFLKVLDIVIKSEKVLS